MFTKTDRQLVWVGGEAEVMVLGANIDRHTGVRQLFDSTHNTVSELAFPQHGRILCAYGVPFFVAHPPHTLMTLHVCVCTCVYTRIAPGGLT